MLGFAPQLGLPYCRNSGIVRLKRRAARDDTSRMDGKRFRLDLPPEDRLVGAACVFTLFAVAHRELTGSPPVGMSTADLALFYTGFLLFPVLGSLLVAALLWFAAYMGCLWAGVSRRAPSFTATLLCTSIVVCGALLYGAYCLEGGQHCFAINPHLVGEGLRHGLEPAVAPFLPPGRQPLPPLHAP